MKYDDTLSKIIRDIHRRWEPFKDLYSMYESPIEHISRTLPDREKLLNDIALNVHERHQSFTDLALREIQKHNEIEATSRQIAGVASATAIVSDFLKEQDFVTRNAEEAICASRYWQKELEIYNNFPNEAEASRLALESHYSDVMEATLIAQERAKLINWDTIGSSIDIPPDLISPAVHSFSNMLESYDQLFRSFQEAEHKFASFPPFVSKLPPIEIVTGSNLLRAISEEEGLEEPSEYAREIEYHIREDIEASLEELLAQFVPSMIPLWEGTKQALNSDNPDRKRHVIVSLREMVTHILHQMAPDDNIRSWSTEGSLYSNGRPTRQARLLFICRHVNLPPFQRFVEKDVSAHIELIRILQRGTHEVQIDLTQEQLNLLVLSTESLLRFILVILSSNN